MINCPHCGEQVSEGETVCRNCGGNVAAGGGGYQGNRSQDQYGRGQQGQYGQNQPQGGSRGQQWGQQDNSQPRSQHGQDQTQYSQPRQPDDRGLGRRELLGGVGAIAAALAGGWYFLLREEGPAVPDTPGESFADAPEIPEGRHGPYEITSGEEQFFAVDLQQGAELTATIHFPHGDGDLDLEIYAPNESTMGRSDSMDDNEAVSVEAPTDGTYYIRPYGFADATNEYELEVEVAGGSDEMGNDEETEVSENPLVSPDEPGGDFDTAPPVPEGRHGPFEISGGESHYFAVDLEEGEELTATIHFSHADGDLDLAVHDPNEANRENRISTTDDETVSVSATSAGRYYIRPYGYAGATNEYELTVEIER